MVGVLGRQPLRQLALPFLFFSFLQMLQYSALPYHPLQYDLRTADSACSDCTSWHPTPLSHPRARHQDSTPLAIGCESAVRTVKHVPPADGLVARCPELSRNRSGVSHKAHKALLKARLAVISGVLVSVASSLESGHSLGSRSPYEMP